MTGRQERAVAVGVIALLVVTAGATGASAAAAGIEQSITVALDDGDAVRTTFQYRLPDRVSSLTVRLPVAGTDAGRVVALRGFERTDGATFEWTGTARPRIELAVGEGVRRVRVGDGWSFVVRPNVSLSYGYRGDQPGVTSTFDAAEGYAAGPVAYLGPYRTEALTAGGERTTFVVAGGATPVDLRPARDFLRTAPGRFDLGVRRPTTTAFVLPARESTGPGPRLGGTTVETGFWVEPGAVALNGTDTAFTHEYVHTRLGVVGTGSTRWLTEATAEYFGHAFALNAGAGTYRGFRTDLRADRYAPSRNPVTLSAPRTWEGTLANYDKGALVLAALDAEIRRRTGGRYTLADVFVQRPGPYADHAAFREAVVGTTGVAGLGDWLDRYVTTDALPPLPDDPGRFVYGPDLDPDGDGTESGTEATRGTNPFAVEATPTATGTPTPTPATAESTATATATRTGDATTGSGDGFGAPGATAALATAALAGVALARRRG